jgi:hypothetical protein
MDLTCTGNLLHNFMAGSSSVMQNLSRLFVLSAVKLCQPELKNRIIYLNISTRNQKLIDYYNGLH